jgi:hypothetical protein
MTYETKLAWGLGVAIVCVAIVGINTVFGTPTPRTVVPVATPREKFAARSEARVVTARASRGRK